MRTRTNDYSRLRALALSWDLAHKFMAHRSWTNRIGRSFSALSCHKDFIDWYEFISEPAFEVARNHDRLIWFKGLRGYLSLNWSSARAYKVIKDSYRYALAHPGVMQDALLKAKEVKLLSFPINDEAGHLNLTLSHSPTFKREGEWCLTLECPKLGGRLVSLGFSVEEVKGNWSLYIGAIQHHGNVMPEHIKESCKALHGIRAKSLLVYLLQEFARNLGFKRILGVTNKIQMSSRKHLIAVPWNKITFEYDQTWIDVRGEPAEDGWYEIPLRTVRRTTDEIKANKRSMYKRRYAFLDQLDEALKHRLTAPSEAPLVASR